MPAVSAAADPRLAPAAANLVFLDPPYGKDMAPPVLQTLHKNEKLQDGALIVVEMAKSAPEIIDEDIFAFWQERPYGNSLIRLYEYRPK